MLGVRVVPTGVSEVLVVVEVGLVNLLEVIMEVGKLLLGFVVSGRLVKLGTRWVVTEWVLIQVPLLGLCVLVQTVLIGTVPVLTEVGSSVMLGGSVSKGEVEGSICVGNTVVILVGLEGAVVISVVEVKTDIGMVGVEGTSLLGSISIHGVVGEVGSIVTDTDSGHGVVEERIILGVVLVEKVIRGDVVGEVIVSDGKGVIDDSVFSVLKECGEVGNGVVVVVSIELSLVEVKEEDIDIVDIEEIIVL